MKIVSCTITNQPRPMPEGMFDPMPKVWVTFDNGSVKMLFQYYPDEIQFTESEFIGLTETQACDLRLVKDVAYLRSPS
jgi:hypothetical protein